jgi:DNA invertase Pin-like site-specific DNA recombinase
MNRLINFITSQFSIKDTTKCAVIYARCSTSKQNNELGQSLHTQIGECMNYCNENGFEISEVISEIMPGHNYKKQSYYNILNKYKNTNLIIADPSRLSRNVSDATMFLTECKKRNITIHSVRDNLICDSLNNTKKFSDMIWNAVMESSVISKRVKSSINIRKMMGSHIGSAPYGYNITHVIDSTNGMKLRKLVENKEEQNIIKLILLLYYGCNVSDFYKMFEKVSDNQTKLYDGSEEFIIVYYGNFWPYAIASFLNEQGIQRQGKTWKSSNITSIVNKHPSTKKLLLI